ncbi:3-hydroxyacyl-ACP dehydratase FabZ family protein [Alienimonas chondri]|uniref:3-hydroxyacyl-[acyl-carrier-protein] dehydratase FabZ n=1 Tax=Alienimonas chondri TaxID=2681879 RepID=A0ABX1VEU9_9PLAN|nr:3-hydroxyacyl-ACP dehydratase FabZ family protein [Alienimonas chondri]NNJ26313.1 3-hydroxyacyl-[acyl-carrier-protein] dehydratase FabZ [Alienimonas chondri]
MKTLSRPQIEALIPHRPPFLWLDEAEIDGETILAKTALSPDLPIFEGHYPDHPLLPGVIQLEMCFQAGAVLIASGGEGEGEGEGGMPVVARTDGVKFKKMVRPGDVCEIEVSVKERMPGAVFMTGKVRVSGNLASRCDFVVAEVKSDPVAN